MAEPRDPVVGATVGRLGVVGAGTMGAGIAQLGCAAGIATVLHDPLPEALEQGEASVRRGLERWLEKGRVGEQAAGLLEAAGSIDGLAGCDLVVEAAPERLELKRKLFAELSRVCGPEAVLATNTSSIPVTALASAAARPKNVVGMHFFNPPPLMRLLEVIRADQTGDRAVEVAREVGAAMGKETILAADGPGFLVNRCGRPFYTEALRCLQERIASHEAIDRIHRLGGGYRMGPFELMDLVGIDTGFEVAKSFTELSFGEPRWRPNPIQARMVAAGRLGRKSGRGYYDYSREPYRPEDPAPPAPAPTAVFAELAAAAGLVDCSTRALGGRGPVGYSLLPGAGLVELCGERDPAAEELAARAGLRCEWVGDAPGLVLGRVVCQLVNEAAFAIGEGVGSADDVDTGLTLGLNHPHGPVAWSRRLGLDRVLATLDGLWTHYREERYRPAPLLTHAAARGVDLDAAVG
ncbi:MAG TPA: 3-hydroxyacyl-CoA dehydrogenase NAD-binding domain-containing protein [Thermoleophilaceae bacterium]|nr:3-hydroxyacyl-CoA dehydrogenase NAD-binding domain-containing protein [Thermoleophilaceae bacterium]